MSLESFRGPGGAQLFYRYDDFTDPWSDAPTAILCHGHPRSSRHWYAWVPLISRYMKVARLDMRGLGLSKVPVETYRNSVDSLILDAIALMDHLQQDKVIWIGEATGGLLGLALAIRVPERLHALAFMAVSLRIADAPIYNMTESLKSGESVAGQASIDYMLSKGMRAWAQLSVRTRPWMKESSPEIAQWYIDQIAQNDPRLAAEFYRPMPDVDLLPEVNNIGVPCMYLDGDRGSQMPASHREALEGAPNARVVTIEGPGIDIGYARPEAASGQVLAFLREVGALKS